MKKFDLLPLRPNLPNAEVIVSFLLSSLAAFSLCPIVVRLLEHVNNNFKAYLKYIGPWQQMPSLDVHWAIQDAF